MDVAIAAAGGGINTVSGSVNTSANWSAQGLTFQYYGKVLTIRQLVTNNTGYTGNILVDIDPLPTAMQPNATTYKPFTYYDNSAAAYLTATLKINTDGTMDYYPPTGVTPATNDILQIFVSYLKT